MTTKVALRLGATAGSYFRRNNHEHRILIAKDTCLSGHMIETAWTAGFLSTGMNVFLLAPVPTSAVAYLKHSLGADVGVMIWAGTTRPPTMASSSLTPTSSNCQMRLKPQFLPY